MALTDYWPYADKSANIGLKGRDWTSSKHYYGKEVRWSVTATTGAMTQNFGHHVKLTVGKWHHVGLVVDKHVMTAYLDGEIQYVKHFTGADSLVQWFGPTQLWVGRQVSPGGNELHDVRHFMEHSLSHSEMHSNSFYEYPSPSFGNGYRNIGEECVFFLFFNFFFFILKKKTNLTSNSIFLFIFR